MKGLGERHLTDDNSFLRQTLKRIWEWLREKLEESGKILEKKSVGYGPLKRKHRWTILKRDCTGWINWLEWDNNLQIAWTDLEWKDEPWIRNSHGKICETTGRYMINTKLEIKPPEKKRDEE